MTPVDLGSANAIDRGIAYLERVQLPSGQFPMEVTVRPFPGTPGARASVKPEQSPFCTALIIGSLLRLAHPRVRPLAERGLKFLEGEEQRGGLWRYWCKGSHLYDQVPPDADDTSCVSALLREAGRPVPDNDGLLIANRNEDGLFYTWFALRRKPTPTPRWLWIVGGDISWGRLVTFWRAGAARWDVDAVVNANVVHYLGERIETTSAIEWLLEIAHDGSEEASDKWYRSAAAFYYAVSRCYAKGMTRFGEVRPRLTEVMSTLTSDDGTIGGDVLQTAMFLCAVSNFGITPTAYRQSVELILGLQDKNGGWDPCPIYCDGRATPLITFASSAATTGFCLEALAGWRGVCELTRSSGRLSDIDAVSA